jgi:ribosomal protein S12 methylthiotransferase accessory factor
MNSGIELRDCFKTYSHDQDKARTPAETIRWVRERLSGFRLNLLSRTLRIDTGRLDVPVFLSLCGDDATRLTGTKKQMGKGATPEQSEASALMELVERFSFFSFVRETPFLLLTWDKVPGSAVSAEALKRSIHDSRTPTDRCDSFLKGCPLRWAVARSLTENRDRWLPIDWFYLINEYNGPAAGNTLEEAILQSLCEVVERHVGSVIAYEERVTPRIDPSSVKDPAAVELLEKFHRNGIQLHLRDFSLNTGIPSVGVLAYDPANFPEKSEIVFAVGTTSSPEKSLCRALTEVAQLAGDFESRTSYRPTLPKYKSLEEAAYLMAPGPTVAIRSLPDLSDDNLRVEIERCVGALRDIGLEVLVLDVTHPELQVPAVYTVIPGAHFLDHTRDTDFPQHMARTVIRGLPPESAAAQLERLHDLFGPRYDLTFFLAHGHELLGNVEKALGLFEEALRQKPDPREIASIYVHMASCRKELGDYRGALRALEYAERRNWELKEIYNLRGFCYYRLKEHHKAIEAFERAIELDPGSAIDYANIGSNLRELGHKEEAVRLYRMALELDPSIDFARENIQRLEAEIQAVRG